MDSIFKSIDDVTDFDVVQYHKTTEGADYFYLMEQSSLQVLRELPSDSKLKVVSIFSERRRIEKETEIIRKATTVAQLLKIIVPLVENGNFPASNFEIIIDNEIELFSHDDGEVHLVSTNSLRLHELIRKILSHQNFDEKILADIISRPNLYLRLEQPDKIVASYQTFDELIEAL